MSAIRMIVIAAAFAHPWYRHVSNRPSSALRAPSPGGRRGCFDGQCSRSHPRNFLLPPGEGARRADEGEILRREVPPRACQEKSIRMRGRGSRDGVKSVRDVAGSTADGAGRQARSALVS